MKITHFLPKYLTGRTISYGLYAKNDMCTSCPLNFDMKIIYSIIYYILKMG